MQTFLANLVHAIRNKETVSIGGGEFSPAELTVVLCDIQALQAKVRRYEKHGVTCQTFGHVVGACAECNTHSEAKP
jgi:hypothetical protein